MFNSLKGIQPGRIVEQQKTSALEIILQTADEKIKKYAGRVNDSTQERHDKIYLPIYQELQPLLEFTEQDIQSFLIGNSGELPKNQAIVRGIYSGVLLHLLTERYEKEKKSKSFTFDLSKQRFDYLFYFAKRADQVTVKNTVGTYICSFMGAYNGKVKKLVIENNKGNDAASWAGSEGGKVGTIVIHENEGNNAAYEAGSDQGNVGTIVIHGNKGDYAASWAGSDGGKVGTIVIHENKGNDAASSAGSEGGKVGTIVIHENKGNNAAFETGSFGGKVGTIVIHENKGNDAASSAGIFRGKVGTIAIHENEGNNAAYQAGSFRGKVGTLALYKAGRDAGIAAEANNILTGKKALDLYEKLMR